eukprot:911609-Rhodomonas_salina.4
MRLGVCGVQLGSARGCGRSCCETSLRNVRRQLSGSFGKGDGRGSGDVESKGKSTRVRADL